MSFKLTRTRQCAKCPWKTSTNPHDIPNGYSVEQHQNLKCTIATDTIIPGDTMRAMACHDSPIGEEDYCVGWLHNQLGVGNNIMLRMQMMQCENILDLKIVGEQHKTFEDTLPRE